MVLSVKMEVWGDYALFTRPEMKVERVSYDIPTPSAARGMLEAVYYHPGLSWKIDRIHILNPIRFTNLRRNEVDAKILASDLRSAAQGNAKALYLAASDHIQQRAAMMLKDVHYVIEAHFDMTDRAAPSDNPGKFQGIIKRRPLPSLIWDAGNVRPISDCGKAEKFRRSMKRATSVGCSMTWTTPSRTTSGPCSSGLR